MHFFEKESVIFRLKNKIIFSGKRNIISPDDTRKVIFQCDFFGKIIFSKHLEKENLVFRPMCDVKDTPSFRVTSRKIYLDELYN